MSGRPSRGAWVALAVLAVAAAAVTARSATASSLQHQEQQQLHRLKHSTQVLAFFERHPKILRPGATAAWRVVHYHQRVIRRSTRRLIAVRQRISASALPPHYEQWLCIHRYEGSWTDPNGKYYGGLQMDLAFQRAWGGGLLSRKGTADHWTMLEQMWAAERAYRSGLGFRPWPNTARFCGLLPWTDLGAAIRRAAPRYT